MWRGDGGRSVEKSARVERKGSTDGFRFKNRHPRLGSLGSARHSRGRTTRGRMATRVFRSRAMGTAAYLEQVSVWREHRDGPIVTRHDGSGSFRSRPASDLQTPATRTLAAGGRTRGRDRSAGRVTRASSTAAGRACECRALGGGCVLNDASFQRETRRNSHTARQTGVVHSRVAAEVISRRRCAFVSSVRDKQTVFETVYASLATSLPISVPPASTSSSPPPRLPPRSSTPTRAR